MSSVLDVVQPGSLVFDVGANRGAKAAQYVARGARQVVCFEPQPWQVKNLLERFCQPTKVGYGRVIVRELALGQEVGTLPMMVCDQDDVLSTLTPTWKTGRFAEMSWTRTIDVQVETLDRMIAVYGEPDFVKIDVEGFERPVLFGLTQPLKCLSFEFAQEFTPDAAWCVSRCAALGMSEFNMGRFVGDEFVLDRWVDGTAILKQIPIECGGDIYARIPT